MLASGAYAQNKAVADSVDLKIKFVPGTSLAQTMSSKMNMSMDMAGKKMNMTSEIVMDINMDVSKHEKGSKVDMKFTRFKMNSGGGMGQKLSYDSAKDDNPAPLDAAFAPLMKAKVEMLYDNGKIISLKGFEGLQGGMDNKTLLAQMQQQFEVMPGRPVRVGESWKKSLEIPMAPGQESMEVTSTMTLKSIDKIDGRLVATIGIKGTLDAKVDQNGVKMSMKTKKFEGMMAFDVQGGFVSDSSIKMVLSMTPEGEMAAQVGEMLMDANIKVSTKQVK